MIVTTATLERVFAGDDIKEAMNRYLMGLDRLDASLIESAFHVDAVVEHAGFTWSGSGIGDVIVSAISSMFDRSMHLLGNHRVEFVGEHAFAESYVLAHCVLPSPDDDTSILRSLRYVDRFEKRDGQWRVQTRRTVREWDRLVGIDTTMEAMPMLRDMLGAIDKESR